MKPNGRRRWRRSCRRLRHREGGAYPAKVARRNSKRHWAWMGGALKPLPAKPFTARSLVGMSMGARKRNCKVDYVSDRPLRDCAPAQRREYIEIALAATKGTGSASGKPMRDKYYKYILVNTYRIGERVRPCPWGCDGGGECLGGLGPVAGQEVPDCRGAGVLPARKANR